MWSLGEFAGKRKAGEMTETPVNKGLPGFRSFAAAPAAYTLPKLAPYQLGYTRKYEICCYYTTLAVVVKHVVVGVFCGETQGRGNPRDPSKIRACQVSHCRRRIARVHAPKAPALPTALHPVIVRRNSLHSVSAVCVRAAKTLYPLLPSSSPNQTR